MCISTLRSVCVSLSAFFILFFVSWPVVAVLSDRSFVKAADAKTLDMRDEHWQLMADLLPILQPLQVVTSLLSTESTPSSSTVYPMVVKLKTEVLAEKPDDSSAVQSFKTDMRKALTERFRLNDPSTPGHPFVVASVLDPATKALQNFDAEFKQAAYDNVRSLLPIQSEVVVTEQPSADEAPPPDKKVKCNRSATMAFLGLNGTSATHAVSEFDRYLSTPVSPAVDPLTWWADNNRLFPTVACVAARYLAIPATSVTSERQFSAAGRLLTKLRSRLEPDRVDTLLFLYKNM